MSTKTYNLGRVVGWSAYEEFLKENPGIDPSIVTEQVYYEAVTYGVTAVITLPLTNWSGTTMLTKTVAVPGAVWGTIPIIGIYYDGMSAMTDATATATNKFKAEAAFQNIYACYISNAQGTKATNVTSGSGYLTFCAHPGVANQGLSNIKLIVRGLGVQALNNNAYLGPEGLVFAGNGFSWAGWAGALNMTYSAIELSDSSNAYRLKMTGRNPTDGTETERTFLSFADAVSGTVYQVSGSSGRIDATTETISSKQHATISWDTLLRSLNSNKRIDFTSSIKVVMGDTIKAGDGILINIDSSGNITIGAKLEEGPGIDLETTSGGAVKVSAALSADVGIKITNDGSNPTKKKIKALVKESTGIAVTTEERGDDTWYVISNTMPYNPGGVGYKRIYQNNFDSGDSTHTAPTPVGFWTLGYNGFRSFLTVDKDGQSLNKYLADFGDTTQGYQDISKLPTWLRTGMEIPKPNPGDPDNGHFDPEDPCIRIDVILSEDTFTYTDPNNRFPQYSSYIGKKIPSSISFKIWANETYRDIPFHLAKKATYDYTNNDSHYGNKQSGVTEKCTGFRFYSDADVANPSSNDVNACGFIVRHTTDAASEKGLKSHILGIRFMGEVTFADEDWYQGFSWVHVMIATGKYKLANTSPGSTGIWNMRRWVAHTADDDDHHPSASPSNPYFTLSKGFGASWEMECGMSLGKDAGRWNTSDPNDPDNVDIVVYATSYADGYNTQLSVWDPNSATPNPVDNSKIYDGSNVYVRDLPGNNLTIQHANITLTGMLYHS